MCTVVHLEPEDLARELDRPDCSKEKKDMLKSMNFYELHAEIYRKVNLDNRLRERQKNPSC